MSYLQVWTCLSLVACFGLTAGTADQDWECGMTGLTPYPSAVSLAHRRRNTDYVHTCGGTLLTRQHILTTATCFDNKLDLSKWQVRAGTICATYGGQLRDIANVTMHPKAEPGVLADLAIVRLTSPLDPEPNNEPARLPEADAGDQEGNSATIVGWGEDETGTPTEKLNYGELTLVGAKACALRMKRAWNLRKGVVCTTEHKLDMPAPCRGDVGGPLLLGNDVVYGVIARVPPKCGQVGSDDAYVDVAMYKDWIESIVGLA